MDQFEKELAEAQVQGTDGWLSQRIGKFTASEVYKLMTEPRSKADRFSQGAMTYILEKIGEEITGVEKFTPDTFDMAWGKENEPIARKLFKHQINAFEIEEPGFFPYLIGGKAVGGASPDGLIHLDDSGNPTHGLEIKCPTNVANHLSHLMVKNGADLCKLSPKYFYQCQNGMMATGLKKWFFVSYHPRVKGLELYSVLIEYDWEACEEIHDKMWDAYQEKENLKTQMYHKLAV